MGGARRSEMREMGEIGSYEGNMRDSRRGEDNVRRETRDK